MFLGYQNGKIKFYTEEPLNPSFYQLERTEYTDKEYVLDGEEYVLKDEAWEEKQAQKEKERIAMLSLTRGDVFRGLLMAKDVTRLMLRGMIENNEQLTEVQKEMALIDFDEALNFYRGNALIDTVGLALGITSEQLDKFFDTNDYRYLTTCKLKVNAIPEEAVIEINSEIQSEITVPYGSTVDIVVSSEGYISRADVLTLTEDRTLEVVLDEDTAE